EIMQRTRCAIQTIDIDALGLTLNMRLAARVGADIYDLVVAHYEVLLRRLVREVWRAFALQHPFLVCHLLRLCRSRWHTKRECWGPPAAPKPHTAALAASLGIRSHALAAQQKGANIVRARALRRQMPRLDHQIQRVVARLHRQADLLVSAGRLID